MAEGWIKVYRQIQDCDIWDNDSPFDERSAWIDLLMLVNHEDKNTVFDKKPFLVKRGQRITSVRKLAERWHWSVNRTARYLKLLEDLGMIVKESDSRRTLVTIVKYEVFQGGKDSLEYSREDSHEYTHGTLTNTVSNTVVNHKQEYKEIKNEKNEKKERNNKAFFPNNEELNQAFLDYVAMRKKIKKPMSDRAITLALDKLASLSKGDDETAIKILNQSVFNSWQGLFELKDRQESKKEQSSFFDALNSCH